MKQHSYNIWPTGFEFDTRALGSVRRLVCALHNFPSCSELSPIVLALRD